MITVMSKVTINRVEIMIAAQKKPAVTDQIALYLKSARNGMPDVKLNNLFVRVVSKS